MKPKPIKSKKKLNPPKDIYKGYEIVDGTGYGGRFYAYNVETGAELWDVGFNTREEAVETIDDIVEGQI